MCKRCNNIFVTNRIDKIYCSTECTKYIKDSSQKKICPVCNQEFETVYNKKIFCSYECYKRRYIKTCISCGKIFRTGNINNIYCSDKCKEDKYTKRCIYCGDLFKTKSKQKKYCSIECRKDYNKLNKKYKNKSNFSQTELDICEKVEDIRLIFNNRPINTWHTSGFNNTLKQYILDRDDNKCYICGRDIRLHVHHIIPRRKGGPHKPENLVTLCSGCHRSVESGNVEKAIKKCVKRALENYKKVI